MIRVIFFVLLCLFTGSSFAGGPLSVSATGIAAHWEDLPIVVHPEPGSCGQFSNSEMLTRLEDDLIFWTAIDNISLSFDVVTGQIASDVTADNFSDIADAESADFHPVVFDSDGTIIEDIFGQSSQYYFLGFAGFTQPADDDGVITSGLALFNCLCIENSSDCPSAVPAEELDATIVHEMGHFIGLDHSAVNEALVNNPCDTSIAGDCDTVPIMYPTTYDANELLQLQKDDKIAALTLYGVDSWEANYCVVTGSLVDADGNPLRCADVQATTSDTADTISFISGYMAHAEDGNNDGDSVDDGECSSNCGDFTLRLDPSVDYTISVKPLTATWISASSIGPCNNEQLSGIIEEEIATISGCGAGDTEDLGFIQTQSTGGSTVTTTDSGNDSSDSGSGCGDNQDFTNCEELISCSLQLSGNNNHSSHTHYIMIVFAVFAVGLIRKKSKSIF